MFAIDFCFLCTKDSDCVPVDGKIVAQVKYVLPEITIIKLGIPLRICSVCDGALCTFSKFKQSSLESSRCLETCIKGAQGPPLHTGSPPVVDNNETSGAKPEKIEVILIKEEYVEETPLDTNRAFLDPIALSETISAEPHNQLHKDRVSQNIQLLTTTNTVKIEEILIKEERIDETQQDSELYNIILKEECVNNSMNDDTNSQPEHNTEDERATFNTSSEKVWEGSSTDIKEETVDDEENIQTKNHELLEIKIREKTELRCNICTELFVCQAFLARHMKKNHRRIKVLSCTVCKKIFNHKYDLNEHMNLHNGMKNFSCSICKKRFLCKRNLEQHIKLYNEQKNKCHAKIKIKDTLSCSVCNKKFIYKNVIDKHMKSHFAIKDICCTICGKSFKKKNYLTKHMKVHYGTKQFRCEICNKCFKRKDDLNTHKRIHSLVKKYHCEICNKPFTRKNYLTKHMKNHSVLKDL